MEPGNSIAAVLGSSRDYSILPWCSLLTRSHFSLRSLQIMDFGSAVQGPPPIGGGPTAPAAVYHDSGSPGVRGGGPRLAARVFFGRLALGRGVLFWCRWSCEMLRQAKATVLKPSLGVYSLRITLTTTPWISTSPSTMIASMLELAGWRRMCPSSA